MSAGRTRYIVEIGLSVALAAVLGMIKVTLPWNIAGGSISLSMLPLILIALRRGAGAGILSGALYGVLDYQIEPFFVHPVQVLLDYVVAFGALGLAGLVRRRLVAELEAGSSTMLTVLVGSIIGASGRFAASFVSGMVFFGMNAPPGQPVWLYSLLYNASYLLPSIIACAAVAMVVFPALERAQPSLASAR